MTASTSAPDHAPLARAAFWLGFALSGFFDGVLLHQVLQWHHLLSAVRGEDLRFQIAADGYFHLFMYAIALAGLWMLWQARAGFRDGAAARFLAWLLIGFGAWHVLDAVASHWLLGIHRIKPGSANPLAWDLGWLLAFGAAPLAIGLVLRRRGPRLGVPPGLAAGAAALALAGAGAWASLPPPGPRFTTVVFAPSVSRGDALAAALSVGDELAWFDGGGGVYVATGISPAEALGLYAQGAVLVSGAGALPGCVNWTA